MVSSRLRFIVKFPIPGLLAAILLIGVACGSSATEVPPTSAPTATAVSPTATAVVSNATSTPSVPTSPVEDAQYSEAAKVLISDGPIGLAAAYGDTPRYGGTFLSVSNESADQFDMHQTSLGGIYAITSLAYNGLLATNPYDPQGLEVIPDLARTWELSDGGATVTFHLAEGVKWHDGAPFSSADVKYSLERMKDPPEGMVSPRQGIIRSLVDTIDAPDPNTVVINGKGPSGLLVPLWSNGWMAIIPKHIVEPDPINALKSVMVGTGAFVLKENTTTFFRFERNPDYFEDGLPYLDEIEINVITDSQTVANNVLTERIYWTGPFRHPNLGPDLGADTAKREPRLDYSFGSNNIINMILNTNEAPFDDIRVRQAISEAINRQDILDLGNETGFVGTGTKPGGPWEIPLARRDQLIGYGPDMDVRIANAKELLASYEAENGEIDWGNIPLNCVSNILFSCQTSQIVQQMLKEIDVDVTLNPLLLTAYREQEVAGFALMGVLGAAYDFDDPIDVFGQSYITNGGRWYHRQSVAEIDRLFEEQKFEPDIEKRKDLVWQMDEIAMNEAGWLMLQWFDFHHLKWDFVKGWTGTPIARSTNSRMKYTWLDFPDLPTSRP